jgi:fructose-1,6-bisphosphatase/inositol monophosphatase family enzyme
MDRMFYAEKGKGAFLNGKKIKVSEQSELTNSVMEVGWSNNAKFKLDKLLSELKARNVKTIGLGSSIYSGTLVASGETAATIFGFKTAHDIASLKIIVEEAGGKVTDMYGNEQRYDREINGAIVSNKVIHKQLLELIKKLVL